MWIPTSLLSLLSINRDTVNALRDEVTALRAVNAVVERELTSTKIMCDWLRIRHNQLEAERAVLLARAYPGLVLPTPEIARVQNRVSEGFDLQAMFEDMGEEERAKELRNTPS
jgi:hypothetical protein